MQRAGLDALIVCGNQYAGFEGAVLYVSGFEIVHRYVYAVLPLEGEPTLVFPREARWIGDKIKPWVKEHVWPDVPGQWICERTRELGWKRVGVYGMNFIMAVRDYRELANGPFEMVPFDFEFDMARAVKSEEELAEVRDAMDIIVDGFVAALKMSLVHCAPRASFNGIVFIPERVMSPANSSTFSIEVLVSSNGPIQVSPLMS